MPKIFRQILLWDTEKHGIGQFTPPTMKFAECHYEIVIISRKTPIFFFLNMKDSFLSLYYREKEPALQSPPPHSEPSHEGLNFT